MKSFKSFLEESYVHHKSDEHGPYLPYKQHIVIDRLLHLMGPSEKVPSGGYKSLSEEVLNEITVYDVHAHLPKASAMIRQGEQDENLPRNQNLHKKIHQGFRSAFQSMASEDEPTRKAKLREAKAVFAGFARSRGYKNAPDLLNENGKTEKSSGEGVHTLGLTLAPHGLSGLHGFDVCPRASSECRANCLGTTAGGNKQYPDSTLSSKIFKTQFLAAHPEHFARILHDEVGRHQRKALSKGMIPGVRLNVTSDIAWEHHAPELFKEHPHTQFYDYTKMHNRVMGQNKPDHPSNYHLTLSHTGTGHAESNDAQAIKALEAGHVVAMVHQRGKNVPNPTHVEDVSTGKRYPIVNGDNDDNTFDRHATAKMTPGAPGQGVVSGLKLKGVKNEQAGKFANPVDSDGIIRINKPKTA